MDVKRLECSDLRVRHVFELVALRSRDVLRRAKLVVASFVLPLAMTLFPKVQGLL